MKRLVAAVAVSVAIVPFVRAQPNLVLTHEPPPRTLKMRARAVAQTAPASARPRTPMPAAPPSIEKAPEPTTGDDSGAVRDLRDKVSFSIDLGYQVESAQPSGVNSLDGRTPMPGIDYDAFRAYGFGEVFGSTRGLGLSSLSSYFALRFQAARALRFTPTGEVRDFEVSAPIATWFERSGLETRVGWAEVRDFLPQRWRLSKLRMRAGGQHIYGPWVVHVDGLLIAYDGPIITANVYSGVRHSDYTRDQSDKRPFVNGSALRVDLRGLPTPLPLAIQGEVLALGESTEAAQPATTHALLQGDWRPRRDIAMIGQVRTRDGNVASRRLEARARYKEVTNLVLDLNHHTENDWRWDPSLVAPDPAPPTDGSVDIGARRYLDLGPVVPRFVGSLRAGTLIAENIDLLVRGAYAANVTEDPSETKSSFAAPYYELGGAFEVRLRRAVAFGGSVLTRNTTHEQLDPPVLDVDGVADPIPADKYRGEDGFTELGATVKLSLGARTFSSLVEFYGRRTRYTVLYEDPMSLVRTTDLRFGGRVTLDAWVGDAVRLFASYDISSAFQLQPEISGYRSLRLMISGTY